MNQENNFNTLNNSSGGLNNNLQPPMQPTNQTVTNQPTPVMPQPMSNQAMPNNMNGQYPVNNMPMNNQTVQPQPYYNNMPNQPKKSNKTLFIVLALVAVVILIAAIVGGIFLFKGKGSIVGKANLSKPDSVAKAYVNALIKKDYKEAKKYIYIPKDGFVNDDDYLDYITRQEYTKEVVDKNIESVTEVRLASEQAEYSVLTRGEDKVGYTVTIPLVLNDGKWYINEEKLYTKNWKFSVPGGTKVLIDGEEVDKKLISGKEETFDVYTLPAIAKESKHFAFENNLGKLESDITATGDGKVVKINMELKDEELVTKAREFIKTAWNDMAASALAKKDLSVIRKYFDDSVDSDTINIYYKNMASLYKATASKNKNIRMTQIIERKGSSNYINSNDIIALNFGYTVNWTWAYLNGFNYTMNRYSHMRLKVDGDSFKIYQVTDEKIFSWLNNFTKDF